MTERRVLDIEAAEHFGILTANITYWMPDHPTLLQDFAWQVYDVSPTFPRFCRFLNFWVREIEGPIHSIVVAHAALIKPRELVMVEGQLLLN
jgi:uncharacterized protein Usg